MKINGLMRRNAVLKLVGVTKSTLYRWIKDPKVAFPEPIRMSSRCSVWREDDVLRWMEGL